MRAGSRWKKENLERWRYALERNRSTEVSRIKTENMCVNDREASGTTTSQGVEGKKVHEFKYQGPIVQRNRERGKEVTQPV